jgi:methionine aminopeptidase
MRRQRMRWSRELKSLLFMSLCVPSSSSDLGVHIDGYIALVAQTFAVPAAAGGATTAPIKGRAADAYAACLTAADAALRSLRPGNKNTAISELIQKIAAEYKVTPVQGVLSHQLLKNKIDGDKSIINRIDPEHKIEECEFKVGRTTLRTYAA